MTRPSRATDGSFPRALGPQRSVRAAAAMLLASVTVGTGCGGEPVQRAGQPVLAWNAEAERTLVADAGQSPWAAALSFAMTQQAVAEAVRRTDGAAHPAAVAAAAHGVLAALVPSRRAQLDERLAVSLRDAGDERDRDRGVRSGRAAAAGVLRARRGDGRSARSRDPGARVPGAWRPTPPGEALYTSAWMWRVRPFAIGSVRAFRVAAPQPLSSRRYARELAEVRRLGGAHSSARTPEQTDLARLSGDHTLGVWNQALRSMADRQRLALPEQAVLLAVANVAAADAGIACWAEKTRWSWWRPITAIREARLDGNAQTRPDPDWRPLLTTPPFPEHPSGHGCFGGAITRVVRRLLGTERVAFTITSGAVSRSYASLAHTDRDVVDARVYAGAHFRFADVEGARLGQRVADAVLATFRP